MKTSILKFAQIWAYRQSISTNNLWNSWYFKTNLSKYILSKTFN